MSLPPRLLVLCALLGLVSAASSYAQTTAPPAESSAEPASHADPQWRFKNATVTVKLTARTPDQIAAFYTARKFPPQVVEFLRQQCFIGVGIKNHSTQTLWLDLKQWHFSDADGSGGEITRHDRDWLWPQLAAIDTPAASRATLRWTLLPERLDFHPDEREGGNILLPGGTRNFSLKAQFATGPNRSGPAVKVELDGLHCATSPE